MTPVARIARICLTTADPPALTRFFVAALGFGLDGADRPDASSLTLGPTRLTLERAASTGRPYPADVPGWSPLFQHVAVAVPDMGAALARLRAVAGWAPISRAGPERLPARSGGVVAFKLRDPEGHPLELIEFPDDRTAHRVDHTAISVADTGRSVAFYAALGFAVAARSVNVGPEQDRLDAVPDAHVEVTGLRIPGAPPPHLELLCYRGDFRRDRSPPDPGDVAATRIALALPPHPARDAATLLRDPDGHLLALEPEPAALAGRCPAGHEPRLAGSL